MKVRIACPHCGFTTWVDGSRIPGKARFAACPRCRERFPLQPEKPPDPTPPEPGRGPSPWEDRSRIGLWAGVHRTSVSVLFHPAAFFRSLHRRSGLKEPFAAGLLFGSLGVMLSLFWELATAVWGLGGGLQAVASRFNVSLLVPLLLVLAPLLVTLGLFVVSGVLHVFLRAMRGAGHGFEGTFRVVAYGQVTQIFGAVPLLGGLIGSLWYVVVLVVGLREIHETSYARVILTFVLMTVLAVTVLLAAMVPVIISLFR